MVIKTTYYESTFVWHHRPPILLSRLNASFGISDTTLSWLQCYLTNRTSSVRIGRHCSSSVTCTTGVPQGSVLGPLLFTAYVSPIAGIAHLYSIDQQQYADDTQLFISLSPSNYMPNLVNHTSWPLCTFINNIYLLTYLLHQATGYASWHYSVPVPSQEKLGKGCGKQGIRHIQNGGNDGGVGTDSLHGVAFRHIVGASASFPAP